MSTPRRRPIDAHDLLHLWCDPIINTMQRLRMPSWTGWGPLQTLEQARCNAYDRKLGGER